MALRKIFLLLPYEIHQFYDVFISALSRFSRIKKIGNWQIKIVQEIKQR